MRDLVPKEGPDKFGDTVKMWTAKCLGYWDVTKDIYCVHGIRKGQTEVRLHYVYTIVSRVATTYCTLYQQQVVANSTYLCVNNLRRQHPADSK